MRRCAFTLQQAGGSQQQRAGANTGNIAGPSAPITQVLNRGRVIHSRYGSSPATRGKQNGRCLKGVAQPGRRLDSQTQITLHGLQGRLIADQLDLGTHHAGEEVMRADKVHGGETRIEQHTDRLASVHAHTGYSHQLAMRLGGAHHRLGLGQRRNRRHGALERQEWCQRRSASEVTDQGSTVEGHRGGSRNPGDLASGDESRGAGGKRRATFARTRTNRRTEVRRCRSSDVGARWTLPGRTGRRADMWSDAARGFGDERPGDHVGNCEDADHRRHRAGDGRADAMLTDVSWRCLGGN